MTISEYINAGLSVIPCLPDKKPAISWKEFQNRIMTIEEAKILFQSSKKIGLICGAVSGNVECIDVDLKYDKTGDLYERLTAGIPADIFSKFVIQKTVSGGYHFWYRCEKIDGNLKLAVNDDKTVLIETRGEGGFAIVYPSQGYKMVHGVFSDIQTITAEERETVLNICRSFNQLSMPVIQTTKPTSAPTETDNITPWDDFNNQHSPLDILTGYGWLIIKNNGAHVEVGRPDDKEKKKSGICTPHAAYIHSTSTPLPTEQNLSSFMIYAWYEHNGDIKKAAKDLSEKGYGTKPTKRKTSEPYSPPTPPKTPYKAIEPVNNDLFLGGYFRPLGFNKNGEGVLNFYFYVNASKSVISLTPSKMTNNNFFMLAPLDYWIGSFPIKSGFDSKAAANWIMEQCNALGYFTDDIIRGRGAWLDNGNIVIHTGNNLIVNGSKMALGEYKSEYLYELGKSMQITADNPLRPEEAKPFVTSLMKLNWGSKVNAALLTGWLAIAPLCGVLEWRPHLWITGSAGSGKSWLFKIVTKMIKNISLMAQADSSANGIRQALSNDALNVIFDEAEGNTDQDRERMENVMALMRAASSGNSAPILKGSQSGQAKEFFVRSCFAFASINPQFDKSSDVRRITLLEISKHPNDEVFKDVDNTFKKLLTNDFIQRFQARSINLIPNILQSISIISDTITFMMSSRELGDQLGTILGGFWHVLNDDVITAEESEQLVATILLDLNFGSVETKEMTDEEACLQAILSRQERIENEGIPSLKTVGEIAEIASSRPTPIGFKQDAADDALKRLGLRIIVKDNIEYLAIQNKSNWVKAALKGSPWVKSFSKVLKRIKGAKSDFQRFSSGIKGNCVIIPISEIFSDDVYYSESENENIF